MRRSTGRKSQFRVRSGRGQGRKNSTVRRANVRNNAKPDREVTSAGRGRGGGRGRGRGRGRSLKPISISKNSIHSQWKRQMGGLIRYYVNERVNSKNESISQQEAEKEVEQIYYRSGCSLELTKEAVLEALGVSKDAMQNDWVEVHIVLDQQDLPQNESIDLDAYSRAEDGKGVLLPQIERPGEGPAHAHQQWTNVVVPNWAIGKSFYFQVKNHTPINLSCEITLDDHKVAKNAPLPPLQTRTVKPDNKRYFEAHKWTLQNAKKVKFNSLSQVKLEDYDDHAVRVKQEDTRRNTPRYNGIRPNYNGERISLQQYPDPTSFGWTFTGSVEESKVEFFEKRSNIGLTKMDWYYTTGTIKTILDHPTTGRNALFRGNVSPEQFENICKNPRAHTTRGYRRRVDRPTDNNVVIDVDMDIHMKQEEDEFDQQPEISTKDDETMSDNNTTYYAKNDNYDFKTQGHLNRRNEMNKLHSNFRFSQWEKASKKEWAAVHAKFYISLPKRIARIPKNISGPRADRAPRELEPLPEQASVVDIKPAENATLGTKFVSVGPSNQSTRGSAVRMNRINGLTDEAQWRGGPLFEKKLFYRSEDILRMGNGDEESDEEMDKTEETVDLNEYKNEKIDQVRQIQVENERFNPDNAEELFQECCNKIETSQRIQDVNNAVEEYYSKVIQNEFNRNQ